MWTLPWLLLGQSKEAWDGGSLCPVKPIFSHVMLSIFFCWVCTESLSELVVHLYHDQNPKLVCISYKHYEYTFLRVKQGLKVQFPHFQGQIFSLRDLTQEDDTTVQLLALPRGLNLLPKRDFALYAILINYFVSTWNQCRILAWTHYSLRCNFFIKFILHSKYEIT